MSRRAKPPPKLRPNLMVVLARPFWVVGMQPMAVQTPLVS